MAVDPVTIAATIAISAANYALSALLAKGSRTEDPSKENLSPEEVQPGAPIPVAFGTTMVPGQVIWQTPWEEHRETTRSGGKGAPSSSHVSKTYTTSVAIACSQREIAMFTRIRAAQKTLWNGVTNVDYSDAEIAAAVADRYDEVYDERYAYYLTATKGHDGSSYSTGEADALAAAEAQQQADLLEAQLEAAGSDAQPRFEAIEFYLGTEDQLPSPIIEEVKGVGEVPAYRGTAYFVVKNLQGADFGDVRPSFIAEVNAGAVYAGVPGAVELVEASGDIGSAGINAGETRVFTFTTALEEHDLVLVWAPSGQSINWIVSGYTDAGNAALLPPGFEAVPWSKTFFKRMGSTPDVSVSITNNDNYAAPVTYAVFRNVVRTGGPFRLTPSSAYSVLEVGAPPVNPGPVTPVDARDGLLILGAMDETVTSGASLTGYTLTGNCWSGGVASAHAGFMFFRPAGATDEVDPPTVSMGGSRRWAANHLCLIPHEPEIAFLPAGQTSVGQILRWKMTTWTPDESPYVESDHFEISAELDAMAVAGMTLFDVVSPRDVFEMLQRFKPIRMAEPADRIKFFERNASPVATIRAEDYRATSGDRREEVSVKSALVDAPESPREVRFGFMDVGRNFSRNTAIAPFPQARSSEAREIDLPIVASHADATRAAWMLMGDFHRGRRRRTVLLPPKYDILEEGDVIDAPGNDGVLARSVIDERRVGQDLTLQLTLDDYLDGLEDLTFAASSDAATKPGHKAALAVIGAVLDLQHVTDDRDDEQSGVYLAVGARSAGFSGAVFHQDMLSGYGVYDPEDSDFQAVATLLNASAIGTLQVAPSTSASELVRDRASTMTVVFDTYAPLFETLSESEMVSRNLNVFAVGSNAKGWEIVKAKFAHQAGDNTYEFWELLRGMRGTEAAIANIAVGDQVVELREDALERVGVNIGLLGTPAGAAPQYDDAGRLLGKTVTFRATGFGSSLVTAPDIDVAYAGRSLTPYAPALAGAYRNASGDIEINLMARARQADGETTFSSATIDQAALRFEIDILDAPGGAVIATYAFADDATQRVYTAAEQTTDFGSAQAAVSAVIYQISDVAAIGRGYGKEVVL